ncbi:response regulator [Maritalea porphyrae]|uniref:Response regulatory domain-containing protein n=1 Tax=Maritalea porphyrae TaxID=880732 RepID=A0ABQ5UW18_9HYPH|nr:response regulator [Maritalea porphyrae]GLQ18576.1 hypothetical protein GCM10007879_28250 [Maritalea porphyrae]
MFRKYRRFAAAFEQLVKPKVNDFVSVEVPLVSMPTFHTTLSSALFGEYFSIAFRLYFMGVHAPNRADETKGPSVVVIETARHMQVLYRSMLSGAATRALRIFSDPKYAIPSILSDPPDVILVDWEADSLPGNRFLKQFRSRQLYPICLTPVIMVMSEVRQRAFEQAIKLGAHAVLAKPISTNRLFEYITWVSSEQQQMELVGDKYVVGNLVDRIENQKLGPTGFESSGFVQDEQMAQVESLQSDVDRILKSSFY